MRRSQFVPLNYIQWITLCLLLVMASTTPVLFMRVADVQRHQNDALHSIICFAEDRIRVVPGLTAEQRHEDLSFYQHALTRAHLSACP